MNAELTILQPLESIRKELHECIRQAIASTTSSSLQNKSRNQLSQRHATGFSRMHLPASTPAQLARNARDLQAAMGSLMAGWNKKPWNDEQLMNRSKTSLTKEEIEEYRRKRQLAMEEHLTEASAQKEDASQSERGSGTANIDIPKIIVEEMEMPVSMSPDWWTRSNNAFLNSPPERDVMNKHSKYAAQFEVANKANQATSPTT